MGGLTSRGFVEARAKLCKELDIDSSQHNYANGRNLELDKLLTQKTLLSNLPDFKKNVFSSGISYPSLTRFMCYMGYGSKIVNEKYPDLEILDLLIIGLRRLAVDKNDTKDNESLLDERKESPKKGNLFRLIRPFFLHRYSEGLVAMIGSRFCRDHWLWKWEMMQCTLAALHRYVPRGNQNYSSYDFIRYVQACGQIALQAQDIFSVIVGTVQRHMSRLDRGKQPTAYYCRGIGPPSQQEIRSVTFSDLQCFDLWLPPAEDGDRVYLQERLFRDFVELVDEYILERFEEFLQSLFRDLDGFEFLVDPPPNAQAAWEKRNVVYEQTLRGTGNPWSCQSWDFVKTKKLEKRCNPEVAWNASMLIYDYLSGTINCKTYFGLVKVWKLLSSSKGFTLVKMVNRLDTSTRDLVCIGKLIIKPPVRFHFASNNEKRNINAFLLTIRIRYGLPLLDGYDHFELLRRHHRLIRFYTADQFFFPKLLINAKRKELLKENRSAVSQIKKSEKQKKTSRGVHKSVRQSLKLLAKEKNESLMLHEAVGKRVCPSKHPLTPLPVFRDNLRCQVCHQVLEANAIMWDCATCAWVSCDGCFAQSPNKGSPNTLPKPFARKRHGSSFNFNSDKPQDLSESKVESNALLERRIELLQDALSKKDQKLRELEHTISLGTDSSGTMLEFQNTSSSTKKRMRRPYRSDSSLRPHPQKGFMGSWKSSVNKKRLRMFESSGYDLPTSANVKDVEAMRKKFSSPASGVASAHHTRIMTGDSVIKTNHLMLPNDVTHVDLLSDVHINLVSEDNSEYAISTCSQNESYISEFTASGDERVFYSDVKENSEGENEVLTLTLKESAGVSLRL